MSSTLQLSKNDLVLNKQKNHIKGIETDFENTKRQK